MFQLQQPRKKALCYHRHSAEDKQEQSVPIQRDKAEEFAKQYRIEIIHEEADEGHSGLVASRPGFDRLFNDWILNPNAPDFDYILVYDVSRWGRFQDPDEAAYYEMLCKKHGKQVIYTSRGFPKEDQKLLMSLQTPIERYMAAEYSRQLSEKVFHGSAKVSEQGYSAGGTAPYGMNRVLLDEQKQPMGVLRRGEHKVIANQRVTFAPSNDETSVAVKRIFKLLVDQWSFLDEIAETLNKEGSRSANGGLWNREKVLRILTNEAYVGTRVYNKTWGRLKEKKRPNPREEWVICVNAFESTVKQETFNQAQERLYWLLPHKWKRGVYVISKVNRLVRQHLEILIEADFDDDTRWHIARHLPVTFGVTFYKGSTPQWCFIIPELAKQQDYIVGIGVNMYHRDPIDKLFILPTKAFGVGNYLVFSQDDSCYSDYLATPEEIELKLRELSQQLANT